MYVEIMGICMQIPDPSCSFWTLDNLLDQKPGLSNFAKSIGLGSAWDLPKLSCFFSTFWWADGHLAPLSNKSLSRFSYLKPTYINSKLYGTNQSK